MEDRQIVDLYWQRSDLAISETNQKYGRYCDTIAYNICGTNEDAEECVSDTWFRAWNLMPDRRPTVLSAFLGRITRNFAINLIKATLTLFKRKTGSSAAEGKRYLRWTSWRSVFPAGQIRNRLWKKKNLQGQSEDLFPDFPKRRTRSSSCGTGMWPPWMTSRKRSDSA